MPALDPQSLPRHLDRLYRAAWALCGSAHDAEDLVQETFARILARPRRLHGEDELAYLMTVLRNTFLTQLRTAGRRPRVSQASLEEIDPVDPRAGARPEEAMEAREIFAAIAALPERYRLALTAVDVVGLSYREAGNVLETREATIATRVFRARQLLARRLAPGAEPVQDASGAALPGESVSVSGEALVGESVSGEALPEESVSGEALPGESVSGAAMAREHISEEAQPKEAASGEQQVSGGEPAPAEPSTLGDRSAPEVGRPAREGRPSGRRLTKGITNDPRT